MAASALAAYQADTDAGKDALLVCDTTEMANALNHAFTTNASLRIRPARSAGAGTASRWAI